MVRRPSGSSRGGTSRASESLELPSAASRQEVPLRPRDPLTSCMELIQRLIRKAGFSKKVAHVAAADLRCSKSKWTGFLGWCDRRGVDPWKTTIPVIAEFFLYLCQEHGLSVTAVKGYRAALNHVFSLTGMDLAVSSVVSKMFRHFERSFPHEIKPPDWNLLLVLHCLSRPPFEPLKLASDKHLTWKTSFLLALASAKRVSELHRLSFRVHHSRGWRLCMFSFLPDFVAKTQNPSMPDSHFKEFSIPSLDDFVGDDRDELLLCPIRASGNTFHGLNSFGRELRASSYIQYRPCEEESLLLHDSFWLSSVISMAHTSASEEDCRALRVRAHEVRKVATSLLFERNCAVH